MAGIWCYDEFSILDFLKSYVFKVISLQLIKINEKKF